MRKFDSLKKEARERAEKRGHDLGKFIPSGPHDCATASCLYCKRYVTVVTYPMPSELPIDGDAVTADCDHPLKGG